MADRFYTPQPLSSGSFVLDGPEAHHLAVVRRFVAGDRVVLFNGDGRDYPALVLSVDKKQVLLDIHPGTFADRELPTRIEIASALPKGDRGDFLVEKLTELGIARFTPLVTERTVVQPKDGRVERFQRAVIEACKQCGRAVLMEIGLPAGWTAFTRVDRLPTEKWILHTATPSLDLQPVARPGGEGMVVAIGPEGGFTEGEVELARSAGWKVVSLGSRVLRVETAAVAVAAWLAINNLSGPASPGLP